MLRGYNPLTTRVKYLTKKKRIGKLSERQEKLLREAKQELEAEERKRMKKVTKKEKKIKKRLRRLKVRNDILDRVAGLKNGGTSFLTIGEVAKPKIKQRKVKNPLEVT